MAEIKVWLKNENGNLVVLGSEPPGKEKVAQWEANATHVITLQARTDAGNNITVDETSHLEQLRPEPRQPQ